MININMTKARDIWRDKIREDREPILQQLDIEYMQALENQDIAKQQEIAIKKQSLRDAPADARIENANDILTLKNIDPIQEILG